MTKSQIISNFKLRHITNYIIDLELLFSIRSLFAYIYTKGSQTPAKKCRNCKCLPRKTVIFTSYKITRPCNLNENADYLKRCRN